MFVAQRPWLMLLRKMMTDKDKERIEKNKKDPKHAMVIKRISKKGATTV